MTDPVRLGLTGSIGMGKSTTAKMFLDEGIPVWDADAAVHRLYARDGGGVAVVRELCPDCIVEEAVSREKLKDWVAGRPDRLKSLEAAIHPLVAKDRVSFLSKSTADIVLLDIPLLFETKAEEHVDAVVVVSAPSPVQRERVLARNGMTETLFRQILERQLPDAQKRKRADYVIWTKTLEGARRQVKDVISQVREKQHA